jgi:hypothetical protein
MRTKGGRKLRIVAPAAPPVDPDDAAQIAYEASMREYRKSLEQLETEATSDLDKTTVTLSGGALGVAMTFLKDVPATTPKWAVWILAAAMLALVVSLLGVLLSLMAARKSMRYELQCLDRKREKPEGEQDGGWWRSATETFNWTALVCCVLGIGALAAFFVITIYWRA